MSTAKLEAAATIIKDEAIAFLAAKHGLTVAQVTRALHVGVPRAVKQFHALVLAGVDKAVELAKAGQINLDAPANVPHQNGMNAHAAGKRAPFDNPYTFQSDSWFAWEQGFELARCRAFNNESSAAWITPDSFPDGENEDNRD